MSDPGAKMQLICRELGDDLCALVLPRLEMAARSLDLAADFYLFELVADDIPAVSGHQEPWLRLFESEQRAEKRLAGNMFCAETCFLKPGYSRGAGFPPLEVWDQLPAPRAASAFDAALFSENQTDVFLHHNLMLAEDLARHELVPSAVPAASVEAFTAAWAVVIDGRLSRLGLPGFSMSERRSRFSSLFSCAGVLLPGHWQIFQSLWDGGVVRWKDVLATIRFLPGL